MKTVFAEKADCIAEKFRIHERIALASLSEGVDGGLRLVLLVYAHDLADFLSRGREGKPALRRDADGRAVLLLGNAAYAAGVADL